MLNAAADFGERFGEIIGQRVGDGCEFGSVPTCLSADMVSAMTGPGDRLSCWSVVVGAGMV
ncbi:MAG: hypothetical protein QOF88_5486, partial [Mycobacterium sp.]|nr:hypothetical protein [Mycobacterium sp.]